MKLQLLGQVALLVLVLYIMYCCLLFVMQRKIVFPRDQIFVPAGVTFGSTAGMEKIWIHTSSGRVESWLFPAEPGPDGKPSPLMIFGHGNAELIDFSIDVARCFRRFGMSVLLVEYPGYGRSDGAPSQRSITEAFVAAYDAVVVRRNVDPSRIVLFGRSLGGGAVCALAGRRPSAALVLMSTFTSIRAFTRNFLVPPFLVLDPFDNLSAVKSYPGPVLIIHGRNDEIIPYRHGEALYRAARNGYLISYKCGHNNCPPDWDVFWDQMKAFLLETGIIEKALESADISVPGNASG